MDVKREGLREKRFVRVCKQRTGRSEGLNVGTLGAERKDAAERCSVEAKTQLHDLVRDRGAGVFEK
jgi:hypothetical protein